MHTEAHPPARIDRRAYRRQRKLPDWPQKTTLFRCSDFHIESSRGPAPATPRRVSLATCKLHNRAFRPFRVVEKLLAFADIATSALDVGIAPMPIPVLRETT